MGNSSKDTVAFDRKNINKANSMGNPTKDTAAFDRKNIGNVNSKGNPTKDKAIFDRKNIGNVNSKGNPTKDKATFDRKNNGNVNSKGNPTKDKATFDRKNIGNENSIPFAIHRIDKRFHNPMNVTKLARPRAILFEVLSDKSTEKTNFYPATPATEYLRWLKTANDILAHCVNNFVSEPLPYLLETLLGYGYMHEFGWKGCFEFFKIDKTLLQCKYTRVLFNISERFFWV
ncbi:hypothetical protein BC833DRAFT_395075 [Globomyces pollinis-pini]|nr:hypothetical protein BC833DRAFT_395075 [Globomyces pollinis-pini]